MPWGKGLAPKFTPGMVVVHDNAWTFTICINGIAFKNVEQAFQTCYEAKTRMRLLVNELNGD